VKRIRLRHFGGGHGGLWLTLLLLLMVLVPSVCLLWFMNQAVQNERLAVRQKLSDAYRAHLDLARERLEDYWRTTAKNLDMLPASALGPKLFALEVGAGLADSLICLDAAGNVIYPNAALPAPENLPPSWAQAERLERTDPRAAAAAFSQWAKSADLDNVAAGAMQAQARCLIEAGDKEPALAVLMELQREKKYWRAMDSHGRLIVPDAELMAIELLNGPASDQAGALFKQLQAQLLDYQSGMAAPQRRFLMHRLSRLFPGQANFSPLLPAEDLAARVIEAGPARPSPPGLHPTLLPEAWQFSSTDGHVLLLFEAEHFRARMPGVIAPQTLPSDVTVALLPPGASEASLLSAAAGPELPGWQLALSLKDRQLFDTAADERIASYLWMGVLSLAAVGIFAALGLHLMRRQMRVTQLKNDLVANVTHELKTPLASMRLLVDTLLNSRPLQEETARQYLQLIASENLRLSRLIDNFLAFSRIERNKYAFDFNPAPAGRIVESAAAAVRERFNVPCCHFQAQAAQDLPVILADADSLVTALLNLLDNAYKYSGDEKQITLKAGVCGASVFFSVEDNGAGLSGPQTKRIFKRFYRVDQRLSGAGGGCGLGLSIVKFIVEAHRGEVSVQSRVGLGSTFTITLPMAAGLTTQNAECKTGNGAA
jgi:signal transduction histidine kinase